MTTLNKRALRRWDAWRRLPQARRLRDAAQKWPSGRERDDYALLLAAIAFARVAEGVEVRGSRVVTTCKACRGDGVVAVDAASCRICERCEGFGTTERKSRARAAELRGKR